MAQRKTRANPSAESSRRKKRPAGLVNGPPAGMDAPTGVGGPDLGDIVAEHGRSLADLGDQVDSLLNRQEWILAGLYDLNVSLASLGHRNGTDAADPAADQRFAYVRSVRAVREVVRELLPRGATVLVTSKGDDALLDLYGRRAWHFPQASNARWAGYYLPDGSGLIAHLEYLRARGAEYLLFPQTALWWLDSYPKFAQHLRRHYPLVHHDPQICAVFALARYSADDPSAWKANLMRLVDEHIADVGTDPSVLDWDTGLELDALLPAQAVFSPPTATDELPYLDGTADVVVVTAPEDEQLAEARRVARYAVVQLEPAGAGEPGREPADGEHRLSVNIERQDAQSHRMDVSTSVVIPTYDGWKQLGLCLAALEETLPDPFVGEVIVVDDGSRAETRALLRDWEGSGSRLNLKVIGNSENCGFTESCNRGAGAATGDIIVFLNDDTLPQDGWLSALLRTFRDHPEAGAVGGKLLFPDGTLQEAGDVVFRDGSAANFGRGDYLADDPLYSYVREVDYCSAALLATPRKLFDEVGGFDEQYSPAYYEDTDYCFAVRACGRTVLYQPESIVVHTEGATSGTDLSSGVKKYQVVNHAKFARKWERELQEQPSAPSRYDLRVWYSLVTRGAGE